MDLRLRRLNNQQRARVGSEAKRSAPLRHAGARRRFGARFRCSWREEACVYCTPVRSDSLRTLVPLLVALLLASLAPGAAPAASAAELPLGKANYAMVIAGLGASSTANWVRLGQYTFATDGTVSEQHWHWTQRDRVTRSSTGIEAAGCTSRDCVVQTANGYQSTGASQSLHGQYAVTGDTLRITWDDGQWEEWTLSSATDGALGTAEFAGSNAAWSARVPMSEIGALDHADLGWVGVAASLNQTTSQGALADDIGVFRILG